MSAFPWDIAILLALLMVFVTYCIVIILRMDD